MEYCVDVVTADASKLKNRALAYAFTSSPYIITAFAGPTVAQEFYDHVGWRWGFGAWAIVFPIVAAPLYFMLKVNLRKAERQGRIVRESSGRTFLQNIWFWSIQFDGKNIEKSILSTFGMVILTLISARCFNLHDRSCSVRTPIRYCRLRTSRLANWIYYRHGRCWIFDVISVRCLRELVCPRSIVRT